MTGEQAAAPRVIVIPPLLYLGFLAGGAVLEYFLPTDTLPGSAQYYAGGALIALGLFLARYAMGAFRSAGTPFDVRKPASALVTEGAYRFSRNPGYLALTLFYLGIALMADSLWILGLALPIVTVMHRGVIAPEERHLEQLFGAEYQDYRKRVRRWI